MAGIVEQTLEHITLFTLNCSLFHGNRKLSAADLKSALNVTIDTDTSKAVMALGVKRVFDKTELAKLTAVKRAMHAACASVAPPFHGGYAVPNDKAKDLAKTLNDLKAKGLGLKADLLARYDDVLEKYAANNPTWKEIIKDGAFNANYVDDQIQFDWGGVTISAGDKDGLMAENLSTKVGGILGDLLRDIARAANRLSEDSLSGKSGVTRRAFAPLLKMADKLDGFIFMDTRVGKLAEMIRHVLLVMPTDGRIEGQDLLNLVSLTSVLASPDKAIQLAEQVQQTNVLDAYDLVFGSPAAKPLPVAVQAPQALNASLPVTQSEPHNMVAGPASQPIVLSSAGLASTPTPKFVSAPEKVVIPVSPDNNPFGF